MRHGSLRFRLAGIFVGFALIIAVLFVGTTALWLSNSLETQFIRQYSDLIRLFQAEALVDLISADQPIERSVTNELIQNIVGGDVIYAQIVQNGINVGVPSVSNEYSEIELPISDIPGAIRHQRLRDMNGNAYLDLTLGLMGSRTSDELTNSYVRLGVSLTPLEVALQRQFLTLGLIGLGIVFVGAVVGLILFASLWRPIQALTEAVQRFGEGDITASAPDNRTDELGLLAREFNEMAARIAQKNQKLEELNRDLQKADRAKTEFLTVMSHELRTPLNAILGYADLLQQGKYGELQPGQIKPLNRMLRAGEHLLGLIENTLNYAKIELGVEKLLIAQVNGKNLLRECIEQLDPLAVEQNTNLTLNAIDIELRADPVKLKQVFLNLIQNALQNTGDGSVTITASSANSQLVVEVTDTGSGMESEELEKLFQPFVQGESKHKRTQKGVGLGLALVKNYTEMHGGSVDVESTQSKGTSFIVKIPLKQQIKDQSDEQPLQHTNTGH